MTKKEFQHAIEHAIYYIFNDISLRTAELTKHLDDNLNVKESLSTQEKDIVQQEIYAYDRITQRYAIMLQPLFPYIKKHMPAVKKNVAPLEEIYDKIIKQGGLTNGCACIACKTYGKK